MTTTLLEARKVEKRFGGVQALADVSFSIRRGEIYGLIGPNGAGKTTLFNVLTGIYPADAGGFTFDGAPPDERGQGRPEGPASGFHAVLLETALKRCRAPDRPRR